MFKLSFTLSVGLPGGAVRKFSADDNTSFLRERKVTERHSEKSQ